MLISIHNASKSHSVLGVFAAVAADMWRRSSRRGLCGRQREANASGVGYIVGRGSPRGLNEEVCTEANTVVHHCSFVARDSI